MPLVRSGPSRPAEHLVPSALLHVAVGLTLGLALSCAPTGDSDLSYHRAMNAAALGQNDWARHYFAQDLEQNPDRLESLRQMGIGWISGHEGSLTHGVEAFRSYLERDPDDAQVRLHLARSLYRLRKLPEALEALAPLTAPASPATEPDPTKAGAIAFDTALLSAQILMESEPSKALAAIEECLELQPDSYAARLQAAKIQQRLGRFDQAAEMAQQAIAADPIPAETYVLAANLHRRLGDQQAAAEALKKHELARRLPSPGRRAQLSPRQELQVLERLGAGIDPVPAAFRQRLALAQVATGQVDAAWPWIETLLNDSEAQISRLTDLGQAVREAGQGGRSRQIFERVLELQPDHLGAHTQLIMIHIELRDLDQAQIFLEKALKLDPNHGPFHFAAGQMHLRAGREPEAEDAMRNAVNLVPWFAAYRTALIDMVLSRGDRQGALDLLADAPASDPLLEVYQRRLSG